MKLRLSLIASVLLPLLILTSCKKDSDEPNNNTVTEAEELTITSDDQQRVATDMDAIDNEINDAIDDHPTLVGRTAQPTATICNATTTLDTLSGNRVLTITYNGNNCVNTRSRTGVVKISIPTGTRWKNAGAQLTVTFQNLKITRLSDNKSITINGTKVITNVSGGRVIHAANSTVIHTVTSNNMSVLFDNNTTRTWSVAKRRTFTYNNGLVIATAGTHTIGNTTGISEWGTNRFGNSFVTSIVEPMTVKQSCNFRLTSGQVKHERGQRMVTVTFGLDANGNPTTCPANLPFYMKITWTGANGNTITHIKPY